jgi:hypothetical protein
MFFVTFHHFLVNFCQNFVSKIWPNFFQIFCQLTDLEQGRGHEGRLCRVGELYAHDRRRDTNQLPSRFPPEDEPTSQKHYITLETEALISEH